MNTLNRRQAIGRIIGVSSAAVGGALIANPVLAAIATETGDWKLEVGTRLAYVKLDPMIVAKRAYETGNGCMYQVFDSIIKSLAESSSPDAEKFAQVPTAMAHYGYAGMLGEGTVCGNINAAGMLVNLLSINGSPANSFLSQVMRFYENEALPLQTDSFLDGIGADKAETLAKVGSPTAANTILCHSSISLWASKNGKTFNEKGMRCKQLSASVVYELVVMLNKAFDGETVNDHPVSTTVESCQSCHTADSTFAPSVKTNMACDTCHGGH
ncbi:MULTISPECIES: cytochrome c3 family protein [Pseudomonadati]|uniref:Cytochrome c3 family protein n=1 Tax=Shewanella aestuarii TaxID=1028752 RepID=A0ABT0L372_9GAMM|nr:cytochrome c3 family protein [Shewanella aestuarii]MCL1117955.1 cytochrome c3 family protein [Shewanella aestuarii]GGN79075.1 cytochrome c [Shewanella aestuarii]